MQLTDKNFKEQVEDFEGIVLVDFFAIWCGPCKMMMPVIEELTKQYEGKSNIKIAKIDIDECGEAAAKYNVVSIPTLIVFKAGKKVKEIVGMKSKEALIKEIEEASK
ncbi:thioredoxin [Patescibacteria group bacterium]|nr:thioredoxin [Patescibacteria group bacterium]